MGPTMGSSLRLPGSCGAWPLCPPGPPHLLLQAETQDLAEAAGVGIEDCRGVAKAAEPGQHVVQLRGKGIQVTPEEP